MTFVSLNYMCKIRFPCSDGGDVDFIFSVLGDGFSSLSYFEENEFLGL